MKLSNQFNNLFISWKNCLESIKLGKIFLIFLGYAVVQIAFILMLMNCAYPPFSSFLVPLMTRLFGEAAIHYPNNFLVLPAMFFWVNLVLSGLIGIILVGTATDLFSNTYKKKAINLGESLRVMLANYAILFLIWMVETAVLVGIFLGVPALLEKMAFFAERGDLTLQVAASLVAIVVGAVFVYTTALVVLDRRGAFGALGQSLSLFAKHPVITILLFAIPNLIRMPVDLLSGKTRFLITKFNPEMVGIVLVLSILISVFSNYLLIGTVTRYFTLLRERTSYS
ncbi:MAG: hypothetical protein ACE5IY_12005 [bacterium]